LPLLSQHGAGFVFPPGHLVLCYHLLKIFINLGKLFSSMNFFFLDFLTSIFVLFLDMWHTGQPAPHQLFLLSSNPPFLLDNLQVFAPSNTNQLPLVTAPTNTLSTNSKVPCLLSPRFPTSTYTAIDPCTEDDLTDYLYLILPPPFQATLFKLLL